MIYVVLFAIPFLFFGMLCNLGKKTKHLILIPALAQHRALNSLEGEDELPDEVVVVGSPRACHRPGRL